MSLSSSIEVFSEATQPTHVGRTARSAALHDYRVHLDLGRLDPNTSLRAWQNLLDGHWTIADRRDPDEMSPCPEHLSKPHPYLTREAHRFVIATKNRQPRPALTPCERHCAELLGLGYSAKQIAYTRHITTAAVSAQLSSARRKLNVTSRTELAALFAPGGLCIRFLELAIDGEPLLVGTYSVYKEQALAPLTRAEHAVARLILRGDSNQSIADLRNTSPRTIANQVQAIFRKMRVQSRVELARGLWGS